jgi:hypothetical protein
MRSIHQAPCFLKYLPTEEKETINNITPHFFQRFNPLPAKPFEIHVISVCYAPAGSAWLSSEGEATAAIPLSTPSNAVCDVVSSRLQK